MTKLSALRRLVLVAFLSALVSSAYGQLPATADLTYEDEFLLNNGGNNYAYYPNYSTRVQLAFGWYYNQRYAHWISSRHDSGNDYKNALDFYLWKPGDGSAQLGKNHVMSITGRGLALGADVWIVPTGYIMKAVGNIQVDGNIECEKLEIKGIGADFVFEENYRLPTLWEVEQHIKQNKHLPGIPPASETEEGVDLGELTETLLQKVEELTLYTIEQEKKIEMLQKQIESMQ